MLRLHFCTVHFTIDTIIMIYNVRQTVFSPFDIAGTINYKAHACADVDNRGPISNENCFTPALAYV